MQSTLPDPQTPARVAATTNDDTPKSIKSGTSILHFHESKPTQENDPSNPHWIRDFTESHFAYEGTIEEFLDECVPAVNALRPLKKDPLSQDFFRDAIDEKELITAPRLTNSLNEMMKRFPKQSRMEFSDHGYHDIPSLSPTEHSTKPDITGGCPGADSQLRPWNWKDTYIVLELKSKAKNDPIGPNGVARKDAARTIIQLAKNGRNLLQAHSSCFSFVIGVYGSRMRIFRFDRAGVISSPAFDIKENGQLVEEFFWRFVNPAPYHDIDLRDYGKKSQREIAKVLGLDPTIRVPNIWEMERMMKEVSKIYTHLGGNELQVVRSTARWMLINVWESMGVPELNRKRDADAEPCDGDAGALVEGGVDQEEQEEEEEEGERIDGRMWCFTFGVPLYESSGLFSGATRVTRAILDPKCYSAYEGVVFAVKDVWREVTRRSESKYYEMFKESAGGSRGLARCYGSLDLGELVGPGHGHKTKKSLNKNERHRERTLIYPVGRPLSNFRQTRELIMALRDAVEGHKIAYDSGVLHRDISPGNILLLETFEKMVAGGFLHDFDYGKLLNTVSEGFEETNTREMTGTLPFMAIGILEKLAHEVHRDLESFYWTLIYIVLRHTNHDRGCDASQELFDHINTKILSGMKQRWLLASPIQIKGNKPLTQLIRELHTMFGAQQSAWNKAGTPATHDALLDVLGNALEQENWPENDCALLFPNRQVEAELQRQIPRQNTHSQGSENAELQMDVSVQLTSTTVSSSSKRPRSSARISKIKSAKTSTSSGIRDRTAVEEGNKQ